jgi:hypothetical protein
MLKLGRHLPGRPAAERISDPGHADKLRAPASRPRGPGISTVGRMNADAI